MEKNITIGDKYRPAIEVTTKEEAAAYFERCVEHCMSFDKTREEAERIERINIGYFAGYYDYATRQRIEALYGAPHPVFGSSQPTAEEAFNAGVRLAKESE